MRRKRIVNIVLSILFLGLLAVPIRGLAVIHHPPSNSVEESMAYTSYILLFLFASLSIVFACRAVRARQE